MTREKLQNLVNEFSNNSPLNYLGKADKSKEDLEVNNYAKHNLRKKGATPDMFLMEDFGSLKGMRFYQCPIFSITRADNPGFKNIKQAEVVGEHHLLPEEWLPDAKTVISFFLPHTHSVVEANKNDPIIPAMEWLYSRVDGQQFILALGSEVRDAFIHDGYKAVTPYTEDKFIMQTSREPAPGTEHIPPYSTNWSERHVGFVTGLGTFGLSTCFISKAGSAGRLISVITDWDTESDECDYSDWLGYCNHCGICIRKCPAQAHFKDKPGKNHSKCGEFMGKTCKPFSPRYGCGKCQSGVPCEYKPMRPE